MAAMLDPPLHPRSDTDTRPEWDGVGSVRRARLGRRVLLTIFVVVLALGATGVLGVRTGRVAASGGGFDLEVSFPAVTRPGHAVPLTVEVRRAGGFGQDPIELRITADYFDLFDENSSDPQPSAETADAEDLLLEFDPPPGEVFVLRVDTRTGPNRQRGKAARVAVVVDDRDVVSVSFRTRVMP